MEYNEGNKTGKRFISHQNISLEMGPMLITDLQCLSYQFNDYFVDSVDEMFVPANDARCLHVPAMKISQNINSVFVTPITEEELLKVVGKLRSRFSLGFDKIPTSLVKHCIRFITKPLTFIFNLSLSSGVFPKLMKIAKVQPVFKKGRKQDISNYRPI
jgi:hypothetical protein